MSNINVVLAKKEDTPDILSFIKKLAEFGKKRLAEVIFAKIDNKKVGFCLFFYNFSTSLAKPCIFIENIYVDNNYCCQGVGKKFFEYLTAFAKQKDCGKIEFSCLNWNQNSIKFYESIGAKPIQGATMFELELN